MQLKLKLVELGTESDSSRVCVSVSVCLPGSTNTHPHTHTGITVMPRLRTEPSLPASGFVACSDFRHSSIYLSDLDSSQAVCSLSALTNHPVCLRASCQQPATWSLNHSKCLVIFASSLQTSPQKLMADLLYMYSNHVTIKACFYTKRFILKCVYFFCKYQKITDLSVI